MDYLINSSELGALSGLPHLQRLAYLIAIRPYMDVKTALVGIKRGISHQSIAEQLYIEPHQGIKGESFSRMQVRRALSALERVGLISLQSQGLQLILKCNLATRGYSVQNKVDLKPTQQPDTSKESQFIENTCFFEEKTNKPDTPKTPKADTPLKDNNYIYLLSHFEKFWACYPEKKSKAIAWETFQRLNPDDELAHQIQQALEQQIQNRNTMQLQGSWVPPWKYPANWLAKQCWNDELTTDKPQMETRHATHKKHTGTTDLFSLADDCDDEPSENNVLAFKRREAS
jgi:hypothetical protein